MGFKWSLVSIPDHAGVQNVGGRLGAAYGPRAFAEAFARLSGGQPDRPTLKSSRHQALTLNPVSPTVEENHAAAAELVREATSGASALTTSSICLSAEPLAGSAALALGAGDDAAERGRGGSGSPSADFSSSASSISPLRRRSGGGGGL